MKYDLSVLIPARNEEWLYLTVQNLLENIRGNTEIIVALDGAWANPGIPADPRVTLIYFPESIGQRAATNQACRLSNAKWVMKLDAHCAVDEGFDVKMMADIQEDWTMIPTLYNLHMFDWVCLEDGEREYQGPSEKFKKCPKCGKDRIREVIFKPRFNRKSLTYRFDKTLHFQYWGQLADRQKDKEIIETLSAQGSCFMLSREKYWELDICDENHGSWGQQGTEVACKTWLSGGRLVTTKKTWYSHMFRTQGGDFGFPYPLSGSDVDKARKYSRELWQNNGWPKAIHDLHWLLKKFAPVPDWDEEISQEVTKSEEIKKGIIFYTDNRVNLKIAYLVQNNLRKIKLPIVSCSLKPMPNFGQNIHLKMERGYLAMFTQILTALEASTADIIFMCEHDILYHRSHFNFIPPRKDVFYYNVNVWKVNAFTGFALKVDNARQVSGLCAYREFLIEDYKKRIDRIKTEGKWERGWGNEPGTKTLAMAGFSDYTSETWVSEFPNIDIRGDWNLTINRWTKALFRHKEDTNGWTESTLDKIPGWDFPTGKLLNLP